VCSCGRPCTRRRRHQATCANGRNKIKCKSGAERHELSSGAYPKRSDGRSVRERSGGCRARSNCSEYCTRKKPVCRALAFTHLPSPASGSLKLVSFLTEGKRYLCPYRGWPVRKEEGHARSSSRVRLPKGCDELGARRSCWSTEIEESTRRDRAVAQLLQTIHVGTVSQEIYRRAQDMREDVGVYQHR
jgi:hypothetical protein